VRSARVAQPLGPTAAPRLHAVQGGGGGGFLGRKKLNVKEEMG